MTIEEIIQLSLEGHTEVRVDAATYMKFQHEAAQRDRPPTPPEPPIKSRIVSHGFFSATESVEYDHQSPQYIAEMKDYEERFSKWLRRQTEPREIEFLGPRGTIKVVMRGQDENI